MRTASHQNLPALSVALGQMCAMAADAVQSATEALLQCDRVQAEQVILDRHRMEAMGNQLRRDGADLLELPHPAVGDSQRVFSAIQIGTHVNRMGALAVDVAMVARQYHPYCAVPEDTRDCFAEMGAVAVRMAINARDVLLSADTDTSCPLRREREAMDDLHRQLLSLLDSDGWQPDAPTGIDAAVLGAFYERFADHAVEVGRRVVTDALDTTPATNGAARYWDLVTFCPTTELGSI